MTNVYKIALEQQRNEFEDCTSELLMTLTDLENTSALDNTSKYLGLTSDIIVLRKRIAKIGTEIDRLKVRLSKC